MKVKNHVYHIHIKNNHRLVTELASLLIQIITHRSNKDEGSTFHMTDIKFISGKDY
jgi:hypothetical protein